VSVASVNGWFLNDLIGYLGAFWLLVIGCGFLLNGFVDRPIFWYLAGAFLCVLGSGFIYFDNTFLASQYLVAGIISTWAMLNLVIFRTY
jgi:hypothetical protein